jgi:hypothetical protein
MSAALRIKQTSEQGRGIKIGETKKSIDPSIPTNATVWRFPITP